MNKVLNITSYHDSKQKSTYQVTKCGDIYVNDDSTDAFLLCSFCENSDEKQILRTIDEFLEHIKWHRSEDDTVPDIDAVPEIDEKVSIYSNDDSMNETKYSEEYKPETTVQHPKQLPANWLFKIIDIFKKCPCLWHSATADADAQSVSPAKAMITKYLNKLTSRNESVEYVEKLFEKVKSQFLQKCTEENYTPNLYFQKLNFLLASEVPTLDLSIYTDFDCTICQQEHESWEYLWEHLCDCHMDVEENDGSSDEFVDEVEKEEVKHSDNEDEYRDDNTEFTEEFIKVYKNHPRLWNKNHPQHGNRRLRRQSYAALKEVMEKHNKVATDRAVNAKMRCLKAQFRYARRKMLESKLDNCVYVPSITYYDKLLFLQDAIKGEDIPKTEPDELSTKTMSTTCTACLKQFPDAMSCLDHMQCAHDNNAFQAPDGLFYCTICNYPNKTKFSLIRHLRHSHGSSFKTCEDCGTKYRFMTALIKHRAEAHNDSRPFKCPQCGKGFTNLNQMKVHSVTHWDVNDRPHVCQICGSKFANRTNLLVHVRRHTRDFKVKCDICDHKSATTTELNSHMLTHTKDYPFICDVCGKACRSKRVLQTHQDEAHRGVRYPCRICGKLFKTKKSQLNHLDGHRAAADKECQFCGQKYSRADALRKHMRKKHNTSKFQRLSLYPQKVECEEKVEDAEDEGFSIEKMEDV